MKTLTILLAVLLAQGCACLTYENQKEGTRVEYCRFCTGSDSIRGEIGVGKIEATGQKQLDPAIIQLLLEAAKAVK